MSPPRERINCSSVQKAAVQKCTCAIVFRMRPRVLPVGSCPCSDNYLGASLLGLAVIPALVAMHLVAHLWRSESFRNRPCALVLDEQCAESNAHVAHLTPILPPTIAHKPIRPLRSVPM